MLFIAGYGAWLKKYFNSFLIVKSCIITGTKMTKNWIKSLWFESTTISKNCVIPEKKTNVTHPLNLLHESSLRVLIIFLMEKLLSFPSHLKCSFQHKPTLLGYKQFFSGTLKCRNLSNFIWTVWKHRSINLITYNFGEYLNL